MLSTERVAQIRDGRRGLAIALYMDVADDDWEEYVGSLPEVLVLDEVAAQELLSLLRSGLANASVQSVQDKASEAIRLLLTTRIKHQEVLASMLEGISGR